MSAELKPCPMCGKQESVILTTTHDAWDDEEIYADSAVVVCDASSWRGVSERRGCGASGPCAETEEEAIEAWNRRAPSRDVQKATPDSLVSALRQYQHNDGSGFVFGYDKAIIDRLFAQEAKDAARYRWLREHWFLFGGVAHSITTTLGMNLHRVNVAADVATLDAAIDAALSTAQEKKGC